MVVVSNDPYTVDIDSPVDFEDIHQRAQVQHGTRVYDINWDSANERVVAYYNLQGEALWFEIRRNDTAPQDITLLDALTALGCVSDDTVPVLGFPLDQGFEIGHYLITPISGEFLMQMDVVPVSDNILPASDNIPHAPDDPSPTSSENESMDEDEDEDDILPEAGLDPVIELID
jgi:hypothetical protein